MSKVSRDKILLTFLRCWTPSPPAAPPAVPHAEKLLDAQSLLRKPRCPESKIWSSRMPLTFVATSWEPAQTWGGSGDTLSALVGVWCQHSAASWGSWQKPGGSFAQLVLPPEPGPPALLLRMFPVLSARLAGCRGAGFCWGILLGCPGGSLWPGLDGRGLGEALSCLGSWEEVVAPGWGERAVCWGSDQALSSGSMSGGLVLGSDSWLNPCLDYAKHQAGLWKALH